jgi:hypothetical protein
VRRLKAIWLIISQDYYFVASEKLFSIEVDYVSNMEEEQLRKVDKYLSDHMEAYEAVEIIKNFLTEL